MIEKKQFFDKVSSEVTGEWLVPFSDLGVDLPPYEESDDPEDRKPEITAKQNELVEWCKEVPNMNWSVGFIDDAEQSVMVIAWWFEKDKYPVQWPEIPGE